MSKSHQDQVQLSAELERARTHVQVGGQYTHYKTAHKTYTVLALAFREEDNELCVIYQAEYDEKLIFIRPLKSWLMGVEWQGHTVPRFTKLH